MKSASLLKKIKIICISLCLRNRNQMSTAESEEGKVHHLDHQRTKKGLKVPLPSLDLKSSYPFWCLQGLQEAGNGSEIVTKATITT